MTRYEVTNAEALVPGQMQGFSLGGRRVLLVNLNGNYAAFDELCPHLAVPLSRGKLVDGCLTCIGHGSKFDLQSGSALKWLGRKPDFISRWLDGLPQALTRYRVQVEAGRVYVEL